MRVQGSTVVARTKFQWRFRNDSFRNQRKKKKMERQWLEDWLLVVRNTRYLEFLRNTRHSSRLYPKREQARHLYPAFLLLLGISTWLRSLPIEQMDGSLLWGALQAVRIGRLATGITSQQQGTTRLATRVRLNFTADKNRWQELLALPCSTVRS